jgi:hypothetical protein
MPRTLNRPFFPLTESPRTRYARRQRFLFKALLVCSVLGMLAFLVSCSSTASTSAATGTIAVQLTDAPFPTDSVSRVDVWVMRVDARLESADSANSAKGATDDSASTGGWKTLSTPNVSVNLMAYQGGLSLPLGSAVVPVGSYQAFRLIIDPTRSSLTLKGGIVLTRTSIPSVSFPSAARSGIKINMAAPIVVSADQTSTVLVDFVVGESFVMKGNSISQNGLNFTPVLRGTRK